jgi:hypothetical protein
MVAVPVRCAVTTPWASTEATAALDEVHVRVAGLTFVTSKKGARTRVRPTAAVAEVRVRTEAGTAQSLLSATSTEAVAVRPSAAAMLTSAMPGEMPRAVPLLSIKRMSGSALVKVAEKGSMPASKAAAAIPGSSALALDVPTGSGRGVGRRLISKL